MSRKRSVARAAASAAVLGAAVATSSVSAHAAATARCYPGSACVYYNSNQAGAVAAMGHVDGIPSWDFAGVFNYDTGNGSGTPIKNNAASADSRYASQAVRVHYNSWYKGPYDVVEAQSKRNLSVTYNDNASWNYHPNPV
ncbi:peptidase inhibitor family I36 protein [Streptomyces sp. NPDC004126]|uniref:peptidase inhibitor family I36 protein n=1 Tax=Streptomyces sp. NPDC004126 TaxID=3390695 RepID=UPI003D05AAB3